MSAAGVAGLVLGLLMLLWYGGAFLGWYHTAHKSGNRPRGAGEWIAFGLGWLAIIAGIVFLLA